MAKLLSVNVGLPQEIAWQGKVVHTAIWKQPVLGRILARRLNLDGDGQGDLQGHGGEHRAVMVYQIESYRYWEGELGRSDFTYGQFGENFTVDGLADSEVCIGDQYKIGTAVFEVTQPRVTCYRLGIRMNNPQMASLVVSHGRPGFYFRVLEEGEVGAGDEIEKVFDGPEKMSIAEIDALLYSRNHEPKRIAVAASIAALSTGWKDSFEALLRADENGIRNGNPGLTSTLSPVPAWKGFRWVKALEVRRETAEITSIVLADLEGALLPHALPGQYLAVRCSPGEQSPSVVRSYSISGASDSGTYRISVKSAGGPGSQYLAGTLQPGDKLEISAPRGDFILEPDDRPVVLLSAGIGVTPVLSMLHALASGKAGANGGLWWIHAARNSSEQAFAAEVRQLLGALPGSHAAVAYSKPLQHDKLGADFDVLGHWNMHSLQKLDIPLRAQFYVCGPPSFLTSINCDLEALGVPNDSIHQEVFGSTGSLEPGIANVKATSPHLPVTSGTGPIVSFTRSGIEVPWDARFKSILELAEACDVPVKWSCRTGVCHTCECGLLDGEVRYAPDPLDPPATGNMLICCSTPNSRVELDL